MITEIEQTMTIRHYRAYIEDEEIFFDVNEVPDGAVWVDKNTVFPYKFRTDEILNTLQKLAETGGLW